MSSRNNIINENLADDYAGFAFIAIGSNLYSRIGSPAEAVVQAMDALECLSQKPLLKSSLWRSAPKDCPVGSPDFVNAVVAITPQDQETPRTLLSKLQEIELVFGRVRAPVQNAPRTLDLDLICFGSHKLQTADLKLPHPAAHQRDFVLVPLAEIAPELVLPGQSRPVRALAKRITANKRTLNLFQGD